ncbi:MAG: ParB/RepB/Spo0J family partition protein [Lachnospiraceae bacterium]
MIKNININLLTPMQENPFQINDDVEMEILTDSIRESGILNPIIVRKTDAGYEVISGNRRVYAAAMAGYDEVPAVVKEMNRDEAIIAMVNSNLQREKLLPSEKAYAYKLKHEAIKRQGIRTGLFGGHHDHKSRDEVSETESGRPSGQ